MLKDSSYSTDVLISSKNAILGLVIVYAVFTGIGPLYIRSWTFSSAFYTGESLSFWILMFYKLYLHIFSTYSLKSFNYS